MTPARDDPNDDLRVARGIVHGMLASAVLAAGMVVGWIAWVWWFG